MVNAGRKRSSEPVKAAAAIAFPTPDTQPSEFAMRLLTNDAFLSFLAGFGVTASALLTHMAQGLGLGLGLA